jgi:hypothetical protein
MGGTHFRLLKVASEMTLHVLAYNNRGIKRARSHTAWTQSTRAG